MLSISSFILLFSAASSSKVGVITGFLFFSGDSIEIDGTETCSLVRPCARLIDVLSQVLENVPPNLVFHLEIALVIIVAAQ